MAGVEFIGAGKTYVNGTQAVHPSDLAIDDGESMVSWAHRVRQNHTAPHARETRSRHRRRNSAGRPTAQRRLPQRSGHHRGAPELRVVPAHDRDGQYRIPTAPAGRPQERELRQGGGDRRDAGIERLPGPQTAQTLGWTTSAGGGLRQRRVAQVDSPHNLCYLPHNLVVGGFIGSPSMNLLEARLVATDHGLALDVGSAGRLPLGDAIRHRYLSLADHVGRHPRRRYPTRGSGTDCAGWPSIPGRGRVRRAGGLRVPPLARVAGPNELVGSLSDGLRRGLRKLGQRSETRGTAAGEGVEFL